MATQYEFGPTHIFRSEVTTFTIIILGIHGILALDRAKGWIERAADHVQHRRSGTLHIPNVVIPDRHEGPGRVVSCTLLNGKEIVMALQDSEALPTIRYVDEPLVTTEPEFTRDIKKIYPLPDEFLSHATLIAVVSAWEKVSPSVKSRLGSNPLGWPPLIQYFRHIRNAAAHGNRFDIRSSPKRRALDPSNPPTWRTSVMADESTVMDWSLIGDWWGPGDLPIFLGDAGDLLYSLGVIKGRPHNFQ